MSNLIERVSRENWSEILRYALAPGDGERWADPRQVRSFLDYLNESGSDAIACAARRGRSISGAAILVLLPGRTGIAMPAAAGCPGIEALDQSAALRACLDDERAQTLHYVQALIEPSRECTHSLIVGSGFSLLTRLRYLSRDTRFPWVDGPNRNAADWVEYCDETHSEFAAAVNATYGQTLDCPELTGLRPVDDILSSHRAAGRFDAALWQLARIEGRPAGALLLTSIADRSLLEVSYMGVLPEFRGRGVGALILQRALELSRQRRAGRLSLVVDERNTPALKLYASFHFEPFTRRDAYLWRGAAARD